MNGMILFARLEAAVMPIGWLFSMGRASARLAVQWLPGLRRALLSNAGHLLGPQAGFFERRRLAVGVLSSFGKFFVELLTAPATYPTAEELFSSVEGLHHGEAALAQGKGVIGITLHMGNFELGPMLLTERYAPVAIVYRPDPFGLVERMRSMARGRAEVEEIKTDSPLFGIKVLDILRRGGFAFVAGDVGFPAPGVGESYPFLDGRARFLTWPVRTSLASGAPLVPCFLVWEREVGQYRLKMEPAITPAEPEAMMRELIAVYERYVVRYPEQWLVLHRYWED